MVGSKHTLWPERPVSERLRLAEEAVLSAVNDGSSCGEPTRGVAYIDPGRT